MDEDKFTMAIFYGGVGIFWLGNCAWAGFGASTALTGVILILAGAVRWLWKN